MNMLLMISCKSVPEGWRTCINESMLIGPAFNNINDLWEWQKIYIDTVKE